MEKLILRNFFVSQWNQTFIHLIDRIHVSGGYAITSLGTMRQKLDYVFAIYDKEKKNSIKRQDMIKVISAMYDLSGKSKTDYKPERFVDDIFALIDVNHDETLTKDEFIEGVLKNPYLSDLISPFNQ